MALILLLIIPSLLISACSSGDSDSDRSSSNKASISSTESSMDMDRAGESFTERELVATDDSDHSDEASVEDGESFADESAELKTERMIIHTAHLQIQVKDLNQTQLNIESKVDRKSVV